MTRLLTIILILVSGVCQGQVKNKKAATRYYEAAYFGQDSIGQIKYGTYFFTTINNYFPTIEEVKALIIVGYKLSFTPVDPRLAIWITEFRDRIEYDKFNHN